MPKGFGELSSIFQGLANREVKMYPILVTEIWPGQLCTHCFKFRPGKSECLQVRKAPVRFTEMWRQCNSLAVGADRVFTAANRFQHMPQTCPDRDLAWILVKKAFTNLDRLPVFPQSHQGGRPQLTQVRIVRLIRQQPAGFL